MKTIKNKDSIKRKIKLLNHHSVLPLIFFFIEIIDSERKLVVSIRGCEREKGI